MEFATPIVKNPDEFIVFEDYEAANDRFLIYHNLLHLFGGFLGRNVNLEDSFVEAGQLIEFGEGEARDEDEEQQDRKKAQTHLVGDIESLKTRDHLFQQFGAPGAHPAWFFLVFSHGVSVSWNYTTLSSITESLLP